jgi:acetyl-CoA carboxylase biotin carboxylase subunit
MLSRILVANRGEIALRIIRACKELGIEVVAIYSQADEDQRYLDLADDTVCVGPEKASESYLDISKIISAAEVSDVEAIHPGYGFLSENSHFAEVCRSCNIGFIGPSPEASDAVGDKSKARELAREVGVPVVEGSQGPVREEQEALDEAHRIGYPVMIKAAGGGGGKGMRLAHNDMSLVNGFHAASSEAEAAFDNSELYIEQFVEDARHIEIQILGDHHGNYVHLGERECSLQRNHQKLVEETPSPVVDEALREEIGGAALDLAQAADYSNAGTVEFLLDKDDNFYFLEVNARLQVEHTITEMVTDIDIVKEQIRIASGEPLGFSQEDVELDGWSIECRINAEDPSSGFNPCPGQIDTFDPPGGRGIRLDSHCYSGCTIPPFYDSLIGKLISYDNTRSEAISVMKRALDEFMIEGAMIETTIPLQKKIMRNVSFLRGEIHTNFLEEELLS